MAINEYSTLPRSPETEPHWNRHHYIVGQYGMRRSLFNWWMVINRNFNGHCRMAVTIYVIYSWWMKNRLGERITITLGYRNITLILYSRKGSKLAEVYVRQRRTETNGDRERWILIAILAHDFLAALGERYPSGAPSHSLTLSQTEFLPAASWDWLTETDTLYLNWASAYIIS